MPPKKSTKKVMTKEEIKKFYSKPQVKKLMKIIHPDI